MTTEDIQDLIANCRAEILSPAESRLLDICRELNIRIDTLKKELTEEKRWRDGMERRLAALETGGFSSFNP